MFSNIVMWCLHPLQIEKFVQLKNFESILTLRLEEIWKLTENLKLCTSSTHRNVIKFVLFFRTDSSPGSASRPTFDCAAATWSSVFNIWVRQVHSCSAGSPSPLLLFLPTLLASLITNYIIIRFNRASESLRFRDIKEGVFLILSRVSD
jgi:hypothetical protein